MLCTTSTSNGKPDLSSSSTCHLCSGLLAVQCYIFINLLAHFPYQQWHSYPGIFMNIEAERYDTWNEQLLGQAATFAKSASKALVFVVSAHRIISDILDHPEKFGFSNCSRSGDDDDDEAQDVWEDDIHLSSAAHQVFADRLLKVFDCR
jgi:lysophospholipase L1-like esterase